MIETTESAAFGRALRTLQTLSDAPLAFGGPLQDGALNVTHVVGGNTQSLSGLRVLPGRGLGGQAVESRRLCAVRDYGAAQTITHHYDQQVLSEGVRGLTAMPVVINHTVRGMLYVAARTAGFPGEVVTAPLQGVAQRLSRELGFQEEVERRVAQVLAEAREPAAELARRRVTSLPERRVERDTHELRDMHAELCGIADLLDDPGLSERIRAAASTLASWGAPQPDGAPARSRGADSSRTVAGGSTLSPRELDVLEQVELGRTNAQAAEQLDLMPETVKAYLRSASTKLQVHSRYQAVMEARHRGLLPVDRSARARPA